MFGNYPRESNIFTLLSNNYWSILTYFKHIWVKFSWQGSSLFIYRCFLNFNFISSDKIITSNHRTQLGLFKLSIILAKNDSHERSKVSWDLSKVTPFTLTCDFWDTRFTPYHGLVPVLLLHSFWFTFHFFWLWTTALLSISWSLYSWQPAPKWTLHRWMEKLDNPVMSPQAQEENRYHSHTK